MNQNEQQNAVDRALEALPEFRRQDDYLLAHGASLMSDDSHEIIHIDTLTKIVRAALSAAPAQEPVAWRRREKDGWWVYYESKAWDDLEPLYASQLPQEVSAAPAQEPVAWYWQHVMQQSQGVIESGFSGTRVEVTDDAMWDGQVATVVTELHAGRKLLPPKFAAAVGLPTEIPASPLPQEVKALRDALGKAEVGLANAKSYDGRVLPPKELASVAAALDEVRAALKATAGRAERELRGPQEVKEGEWLPIESAPKDGTQILLTNGKSVAQGWWEHQEPYIREKRDMEGRYIDQDESDGYDGWLDCEGGMLPDPTHWQPLPPPPSATLSASSKGEQR